MSETPAFVYDLVSIVPSFVIGLLYIRTACMILELRSNRVYALCHLMNVVANMLALKLGWPLWLRLFILNPSTTIIMPILYSRGSLVERIFRVLSLYLFILPAEAASVGTYMLLGHGPFFSTIDETNYIDIALTYCVTILLSALLLESLIFFYRRRDGASDAHLEPSVLANMIACYFLSLFTYARIVDTSAVAPAILSSLGFVALFEAVYALITLVIARRDAAAMRITTDAAASTRQARHVAQSIEASVQTSRSMRYLRHDLANQRDLVLELAASGHQEEAGRYLKALHAQIHELMGDQS